MDHDTPFRLAYQDSRARTQGSVAPLFLGALITAIPVFIIVGAWSFFGPDPFARNVDHFAVWFSETASTVISTLLMSKLFLNLARMALRHTPEEPARLQDLFEPGVVPDATSMRLFAPMVAISAFYPPSSITSFDVPFLVYWLWFLTPAVITALFFFVVWHHVHTGEPAQNCWATSIALVMANVGPTLRLMLQLAGYAVLMVITVGIAAIWLIPASARLGASMYLAVRDELPRDMPAPEVEAVPSA